MNEYFPPLHHKKISTVIYYKVSKRAISILVRTITRILLTGVLLSLAVFNKNVGVSLIYYKEILLLLKTSSYCFPWAPLKSIFSEKKNSNQSDRPKKTLSLSLNDTSGNYTRIEKSKRLFFAIPVDRYFRSTWNLVQ